MALLDFHPGRRRGSDGCSESDRTGHQHGQPARGSNPEQNLRTATVYDAAGQAIEV